MTVRQEEEEKKTTPSEKEMQVSCPLCGNQMTFIQVCHVRCNVCGSELSCEDKGWFWG